MTRLPGCPVLWLLPLGSCSGLPGPLDLPPIPVAVAYAPAVAREVPTGAAPAPATVSVDVMALRHPPGGASLEAVSQAITTQVGEPFRATSSLPPGSAWLDPTATAAWVAALRDEGAAAAPVNVQRLGTASAVVDPTLQTVVAAGLDSLPRLRFTMDDSGCRVQIDPPPTEGRSGHHLLLRDPLPTTGSCMVFVASGSGQVDHGAAGGRRIAGHAVRLTLAEPPSADAVETARSQAAITPPATATAADQQAALAQDAIGEHNRRPALLAIAQQLRLPVCIDALLSADEPRLVAITAAIAAATPTDAAYPWLFERAVWSAHVPALQRDELPPGPHGSLLRHLGALAYDPNTLQLRLATSGEAATFAAAVREENVYALHSRDPVLRERAHDWLTERGQAVPGFDPMAPLAARRLALRRHAAATAAAAAAAAAAAGEGTR